MKPLKISFKSFDASLFSFYQKRIITRLHDDIDNFKFTETLRKLSKNYRRSPFKRKSAYLILDMGEKQQTFKISYTFDGNKLYFKLLVRTGGRFVRLTQMIIQNLH